MLLGDGFLREGGRGWETLSEEYSLQKVIKKSIDPVVHSCTCHTSQSSELDPLL